MRMRIVHPRADGVIATSRYLYDFYRGRGCEVVELPTLCDVSTLSEIPALERVRAPDVLYVTYAGSPFDMRWLDRERENVKDRLDAVISLVGRVRNQHRRVVLEICGLTKENYLLAFPEHASLLAELTDTVVFLGRRSHEETIARIKASDFTIFLRRESRATVAGFPTKFSESVCCGTPVITNVLSNIERYLIEGVNGFSLDIDNPRAQDVKMLSILDLPPSKLDSMRSSCLLSRELDFHTFAEPVRRFLTVLARSAT